MIKIYRKYKLIICTLVVIISYFIIIQNSITAEENSVFGDIAVYPSKPTPLSVVSFTSGVNSNITVEAVRLIVQECAGDLCFLNDFNVSMNYTYTCCMDFYETQITLIHEGATQIKYYVKILNNGTWYNSDTNVTNLSIPTSNNPVIISDNRTLPGFETPLIILSIALILVLNRWRRKSGGSYE